MAAIEAQIQRYQGVQKESAGYKLMAAMGWKEGEGLGASKQGIKEHIRVKKNYENWGVGAVTAADRAKEWTAGMSDFHRVLSTLSEITSQHAGKEPGEEDSEDEGAAMTTDEESDASDGELRKKIKKEEKTHSKAETRNRKKEEKKLMQQQKKNKKNTSSSSGSDDESEGEDAAPTKRAKLATHLGRFKKRESAKMVSKYSSHDLAAILGEDPFAAAAAAVTAAGKTGGHQTSDGYESDSESDSDVEVKKKKKQKRNVAKTKKIITIQEHQEAQQDAERELKQDTRDTDEEDLAAYWWSSYFVRRGKMGSLRRTAPNCARGFSEQDQTDLFTKTYDGATQGRVGLGRSSMPKKVAGARWEGKKKKLGSDSEDSVSEGEQEQREAKEAAALEKKEAEEEEARGVVVVLPGGVGSVARTKKRKKEARQATGEKKVKWKKAVAAVLSKENSGSMNFRAVVKAVMAAEKLDKNRKTEASEAIFAVVEGSSKFKLDGKNVKLA